MAVKKIPRVDGRASVTFDYGEMSRNSVAWSPDTGAAVGVDVPRIAEDRIPVLNFEPVILHTFTSEVYMSYKQNLPYVGPNWCVGAGGRLPLFESQFPEFTKLTLGASFLGEDIFGYRLTQNGWGGDPLNTKHFVVINVVHGNEVAGLNGSFKAIEILARNPLFQSFRDEWTLLFIPFLNPDGWSLDNRNLAEVGPDGVKTVNLNRNFDWFWDQYTESSSESKGAAPGSSSEAQALLTYYASVGAAGGRFGAIIDMHATEGGGGARYYTRDRIQRDVIYKRNEGGNVPDSFLTVFLEYYIWQLDRAWCVKRRNEAGGKDFFLRYYKSRYEPKLHSYFSSQGVFSTVAEDVKVASAPAGTETYSTACNFRMDHILATAAACTAANWSYEDAVLIEKGTDNLLQNSSKAVWRNDETRPSYYKPKRSTMARQTTVDGEKFFDDNGEVISQTSAIDIVLPDVSEFTSVATYKKVVVDPDTGVSTDTYDNFAALNTGRPSILDVQDSGSSSAELFDGTFLHITPIGAAMFYSGTQQVDVLCGGTAEEVGAGLLVTRVNLSALTQAAVVPVGLTARMHMGYCDNMADFPTAANIRGYMVGGINNVGAYLTSMGTWNPNTNTFTASTQILAAGTLGCAAVYNSSDNCVYIFGGKTGAGFITTIYKWDVGADTLSTLVPVLPEALAHLTGVYNRSEGVIWLFGGQNAAGDMNYKVYEFDSSALTIAEKEVLAGSLDDEDNEDGSTGVWTREIGRWAATALYEDTTDDGSAVLIGGRETDTAGTVLDTVFEYQPNDNVISIFANYSYGYWYYTSLINLGFTSQVADTFDDLSNWTDASGNWSAAANEARVSLSGNLILNETPDYINEYITAAVKYSAAGIDDFAAVLRGTYVADVLTDGYRLLYDLSATTWILQRLNSGGVTTLDTYNVAADATRRPTTSNRTLIFQVDRRNGVLLTATFNGNSLFSFYDFDTTRVNDIGQAAFEATGGGGQYWAVSSFDFKTSGRDEESLSLSVFVKAAAGTTAGYHRLSVQPKSTIDSKSSTRSIATYYMVPPEVDYMWYKVRVDLKTGKSSYREDGLWCYSRVYKHSETLFCDGPQLQKGSLLASSYQKYGVPREDETFTFADILNLNNFKIEFYFLPTASFAEIDSDLELFRLYADANNYIKVTMLRPTNENEQLNREYSTSATTTANETAGQYFCNIASHHDPVLRLEKVRAGVSTATLDCICYLGYSNLSEGACELVDDVCKFSITHQTSPSGVGFLEFKVNRFGSEGRQTSFMDPTPFTVFEASLRYTGVGYFSQPTIVDLENTIDGRFVPTARKGLVNRIRKLDRNQFMSGDRDPTRGQLVDQYYYNLGDFTFGVADTFNRVDSLTLGGMWSEFSTYPNWRISSNRARGSSNALARWKNFPRHSDYTLEVDVESNAVGCAFNLLGRWDYYDTDDLTGYGLEFLTGIGVAAISINRFFRYDVGAATGYKDALAVMIIPYTLNTTVTMQFSLEGSILTGTIIDPIGGGGTFTETDTNWKLGGYIGLLAETPGAGNYIYLNNFSLYPNFPNVID